MSNEHVNAENQNLTKTEDEVSTQVEEMQKSKTLKEDCSYMKEGGLGGDILDCYI